MSHQMDYFTHLQPENGGALLPTQESGDAGLSSNMAHKCYDNNKSALPVEDKGSSVIPIPARELQGICEGPETAAKIKQPFSFGNDPSMIHHKQPVAAEKGLSKPAIFDLQKNNFPPQTTPIALSEKEEETFNPLPRTTVITEAEAEVRGEDNCTVDTEMESEGDSTKPKGPILVPGGGGRNRRHRRKRAAAKYWKWYLLSWMTLMTLVSVCDGNAVQCFSCVDKDVCPNLLNIYKPDDTRLYHGNHTQPFPDCTEVHPPYSKSCCVCYDKSVITIICSGEVGSLEVESSGGAYIVNTTVSCPIMENNTTEVSSRSSRPQAVHILALLPAVSFSLWWRCRW
ncbi:hypothetical protein PAMA_015484 [Pampus argenteus]